MFVREVRARDIRPLPEEMSFKKTLKNVSCFRRLHHPVANHRKIPFSQLKT
jgi:hypothetical protein